MRHSNALAPADHDRIMPTARMVAYYRSFSDIPYAQQAAAALGAEEAARNILGDDLDIMTRFSGPILEARYKCFDRFIAAHRNVLELAVGTSIERGLTISSHPTNAYVGTDLPQMIQSTRILLNEVCPQESSNHHLVAANVLSLEELNCAVEHFDRGGDIQIINEGLLLYLTVDERRTCAGNIRSILAQYGGRWITPDIIDRESTARFVSQMTPDLKSAFHRTLDRIGHLTGRDIEKRFFNSREQAVDFFESCGFKVELFQMVKDTNNLASIGKLWGERERCLYEPALKQELVWVMSLP